MPSKHWTRSSVARGSDIPLQAGLGNLGPELELLFVSLPIRDGVGLTSWTSIFPSMRLAGGLVGEVPQEGYHTGGCRVAHAYFENGS